MFPVLWGQTEEKDRMQYQSKCRHKYRTLLIIKHALSLEFDEMRDKSFKGLHAANVLFFNSCWMASISNHTEENAFPHKTLRAKETEFGLDELSIKNIA